MRLAEQSTMSETHARACELLPWYLNDSLADSERAEVRAHLGECLVCHAEMRRLEQLECAIAAPVEEHACAQSFARLAMQIEEGENSRSWPQRALDALRDVFEPVPLFSGAALLVVSSVLVGAIVIGGQTESRPIEQPFRTLGNSPSLNSELGRPLMRMVLRGDTSDENLTAWLSRHRAELIEGPSDIGVVTVRVPMGAQTFDALMERLRADEQTLFIEPLQRIGTRPDRLR
jgi:anti-sigma factor RsiW